MTRKTVYSFHPETKEYLGQTVAHESPLEPGVYHIPAYAVEAEPIFNKGKVTKWNGEKWVLEDAPALPKPKAPLPKEKKERGKKPKRKGVK